MYLSRIELDLHKRETGKAFYDRGRFHSLIENCFEGERQHPLWRLDKSPRGYILLILSKDMPEFSHLEEKIGAGTSRTLDYRPLLPLVCQNGKMLNFQVTVNPVIYKDGHRIPLNLKRTPQKNYCAADWLKDRLEKNGAQLVYADYIEAQTVAIKGGKGKIFTVTYHGQLQVTDAALFEQVLEKGLGHAKAYGCGFMTVLPC